MSDNKIGYKNPPKDTQFKKGQSGNLAGRPKGSKNVKTILYEAMNEEVQVTISGNIKKMSKKEALIHKIMNDAL